MACRPGDHTLVKVRTYLNEIESNLTKTRSALRPRSQLNIFSIIPRAAASISPIFDGSLPPASAKSGRPPPPPPTIGAICFTTWPADTFLMRSGVTPTTIETLPSDGRRQDDDAALDAGAMLIDERAEAVLVEAAHLARDQLHAGHVDRLVR